MDNSSYITIAKIGAPYGVRGELKLHSFADPSDRLLSYSDLHVQKNGQWCPLPPHTIREHGGGFLIKFDECSDRDQARQKYLHWCLGVPREQLPDTEENEHYWADLVGLEVWNKQQVCLGQVHQLLETGANDVLEVKKDNQSRLIPFISQFVLSVNLEAGRVEVDWEEDF